MRESLDELHKKVDPVLEKVDFSFSMSNTIVLYFVYFLASHVNQGVAEAEARIYILYIV